MGNLIAASMFDGNLEAVDRQDSYSGYCPSTCSSGYISQYCACPASNQGLVIDRNLLLALVLGAAAAVFAIYQAFVVKAAAAGRDFPEIPGFFDTFRLGKIVKIFLIWNCTTEKLFLLLPPLTNITNDSPNRGTLNYFTSLGTTSSLEQFCLQNITRCALYVLSCSWEPLVK